MASLLESSSICETVGLVQIPQCRKYEKKKKYIYIYIYIGAGVWQNGYFADLPDSSRGFCRRMSLISVGKMPRKILQDNPGKILQVYTTKIPNIFDLLLFFSRHSL